MKAISLMDSCFFSGNTDVRTYAPVLRSKHACLYRKLDAEFITEGIDAT